MGAFRMKAHWTSRTRLSGFVAACVLASLCMACAKPTRIAILPKDFVLRSKGASRLVQATVLDQKDRPMDKVKISYESSDPSVAKVNGNGKVTAEKSGETTITVKAGKLSGTVHVTVKIIASLALSLPQSGAVGLRGAVIPLSVSAADDEGQPVDLEPVRYVSSNPQVASVDDKGRVTLLADGTAIITATLFNKKAELPLNVQIQTPAAIQVDKPHQSFKLGATKPLAFAVISDNGSPIHVPAAFDVSEPRIASVDKDGNLTALARGTTTVTIVAGKAKNTVKITVH